MMLLLCLAPAVIIAFLLVRVALVLQRMSEQPLSSHKKRQPSTLLAVLGSGGHTKEMIALLDTLCKYNYTPRIYCLASTDKFSEGKILSLQKSKDDPNFTISQIPRSREVNQSYLTSAFTTLHAVLYTLPLVFRSNPDIVLCNGPGTCIPICIWVFLSKVLLCRNTKLVFIESICRVKTLSLSGRLVYRFCDYFIVQWPELEKKYPWAMYIGRLL